MDEINQKIEALRKKYPDEQSVSDLQSWEKNAKIAVMTANLQENDAIKLILDQYRKELNTLNKMLMGDETLFKNEDGRILGQMIHTRKKWCEKFLGIFTKADSQVKAINNTLDKSLE